MGIREQDELELCKMLVDCCAQEKTFRRFYALLAQRFATLKPTVKDIFALTCFPEQYESIHMLETNKLRNVAMFFSHLLHSDAIPWTVLEHVHLNEEETNSSKRIFIKILFKELAEFLGLKKLNERLQDADMNVYFQYLLPKSNPKDTRFAINFFTAIGLGGLTVDLRAHLKKKSTVIKKSSSSSSSSSDTSDTSDSSDPSDDSDSDSDDKKKKKKKTKKLNLPTIPNPKPEKRALPSNEPQRSQNSEPQRSQNSEPQRPQGWPNPPRERGDRRNWSPPRRDRGDTRNVSPPRRERGDPRNISPPRRDRGESRSPPRRERGDPRNISPPRRDRGESRSPPRRERGDKRNVSPFVKYNKKK